MATPISDCILDWKWSKLLNILLTRKAGPGTMGPQDRGGDYARDHLSLAREVRVL